MAMQDLVREINSRAKKMSKGERLRNIRDLVAESPENEEFIREYFPRLYEEALSSASRSVANAAKESGPSLSRCVGR
jgi:hypothetical protein